MSASGVFESRSSCSLSDGVMAPCSPVVSRSAFGTRGILIETMQLVDSKRQLPIPDHLLETKIYAKLTQNGVIEARPSVVHFAGFEPCEMHRRKLELLNMSGDVQIMHIIPPRTRYFTIKYSKNCRLVPGLALKCVIEFVPDECRYYYDCVRVHCKGEENLVIPIHAYPVMNTSEFPKEIDFGNVPIGQMCTKMFPLRCQAPIDFEYQLTVLQPHPSFSVCPLYGVVPANNEVEVMLTYMPTAYCTAVTRLQLNISQFHAQPMICTVFGHCDPGSSSKGLLTQCDAATLDPRMLTPLDRARSKRCTSKSPKSCRQETSVIDDESEEVEIAGLRFPRNLDSVHAVNHVLNQQRGKMSQKDMRKELETRKKSLKALTRQMKETSFELAVRENVYEERQNQLRWQVKLGEEPVPAEFFATVLAERNAAWNAYRIKRGDPDAEDEVCRSKIHFVKKKTLRDVSSVAPDEARFDVYVNDMCATRHVILSRFQQAARKVIMRRRIEPRIKQLRQALFMGSETSLDPRCSEQAKKKEETKSFVSIDRVSSITFPYYVAPDYKDELAVDALGAVIVSPISTKLKEKVPYVPLKVPQQYKLLSYERVDVHDTAMTYIPPILDRKLRTGAEDEIIILPMKNSVPAEVEPMKVVEVTGQTPPATPLPRPTSDIIPLNPPRALFQPAKYPPLHIFNPEPGLQTFLARLPYSETDADFHLCPLPRYFATEVGCSHMATQKQFLDREETIKGMMTWKKFPSPSLATLQNNPTLSTVWLPRWTDPFGSELLPTVTPPFADTVNSSESNSLSRIYSAMEDEDMLTLTPEMVKAEFSVDDESFEPDEKPPESSLFPFSEKISLTSLTSPNEGPLTREQREVDLEYFLQKKFNSLTAKMNARIKNLDDLKTNKALVLN